MQDHITTLEHAKQECMSQINGHRNSLLLEYSPQSGATTLLQSILFECDSTASVAAALVVAGSSSTAGHAGAMTWRRWSGLLEVPESCHAGNVAEVYEGPRLESAALRIKKLDVLLLDRLQYISPSDWSLFNLAAQYLRKNRLPFGGICIVAAVDFYELPSPMCQSKARENALYVFDAKDIMMRDTFLGRINIECKIGWHRQPTEDWRDKAFGDWVSHLRLGNSITGKPAKLFRDHIQIREYSLESCYTHLFGTGREAAEYNGQRIARLDGVVEVYCAVDSGDMTPETLSLFQADMEEMDVRFEIDLKVGACVQLSRAVSYLDVTIPAGTMGTVTRLMKLDAWKALPGRVSCYESRSLRLMGAACLWPVCIFEMGDDMFEVLVGPYSYEHREQKGNVQNQRHQIPLSLAWAMTVHRAAGRSFEKGVVLDLQSVRGAPGLLLAGITRTSSYRSLRIVSSVEHDGNGKGFFGCKDSVKLYSLGSEPPPLIPCTQPVGAPSSDYFADMDDSYFADESLDNIVNSLKSPAPGIEDQPAGNLLVDIGRIATADRKLWCLVITAGRLLEEQFDSIACGRSDRGSLDVSHKLERVLQTRFRLWDSIRCRIQEMAGGLQGHDQGTFSEQLRRSFNPNLSATELQDIAWEEVETFLSTFWVPEPRPDSIAWRKLFMKAWIGNEERRGDAAEEVFARRKRKRSSTL